MPTPPTCSTPTPLLFSRKISDTEYNYTCVSDTAQNAIDAMKTTCVNKNTSTPNYSYDTNNCSPTQKSIVGDAYTLSSGATKFYYCTSSKC